jgi:hypothetical protein
MNVLSGTGGNTSSCLVAITGLRAETRMRNVRNTDQDLSTATFVNSL